MKKDCFVSKTDLMFNFFVVWNNRVFLSVCKGCHCSSLVLGYSCKDSWNNVSYFQKNCSFRFKIFVLFTFWAKVQQVLLWGCCVKVEGLLLEGPGKALKAFFVVYSFHRSELLWQTYTLLSQQLQDKLNLEGLVQVFRASVLFLLKLHFHGFFVNLRNLTWCIWFTQTTSRIYPVLFLFYLHHFSINWGSEF